MLCWEFLKEGMVMSVLDSIFNYNERLIVEEMAKQLADDDCTEEQLSDIACLALNKVPAKYIKHSVDRAFYMSMEDRVALEEGVTEAVAEAIRFIMESEH